MTLTDEQFKTFLEKTISTEYTRKILRGLTGQNGETPIPEPVKMTHPSSVANSRGGGNVARTEG